MEKAKRNLEDINEEENVSKEMKYQELNNKFSKILEDYDLTSSQLKMQKEQNEKNLKNLNEINKKYTHILINYEEKEKNELISKEKEKQKKSIIL